MTMEPPAIGGFSLSVQLFAPGANAIGDRPIRCFRVSIPAGATILEFCEEASRIHDINYGLPISIKKCQDDQGFDVTAKDIVEHLFKNKEIIRVTQETATPSVRDSVPPESALRYNPGLNINRKRERSASVRPNGSAFNKRQKVLELDPDHPIPSLETGPEIDGSVRGTSHRGSSMSTENYVRTAVPMVPETPQPSPEPPALFYSNTESDLTDLPAQKTLAPNGCRQSPILPQLANGNSSKDDLGQNPGSGGRSASYHIPRATERGRSVSTAATSPESLDAPRVSGISSSKRKIPESASTPRAKQVNGSRGSKAPEENIESDTDVTASGTKKTKSSQKPKKSSPGAFPALDWAKGLTTPPPGPARPREQRGSTELPLTPGSRERVRKDADEAKRAQSAAAKAAELRQQEAEARKAEEAKEAIRRRSEEVEREARAKRDEVIAKAARFERERLERVEAFNRAEQERLEQEKKNVLAEQGKKAEDVKARQSLQRREKEEALAEKKAALLRKEKEERDAATVEKQRVEAEKQDALNKASVRPSKSLTPELAKKTPVKPQSSTPFIPSGRRKSALKSSIASSPLLTKDAKESPAASLVESETGDVSLNGLSKNRRVSFGPDKVFDVPSMDEDEQMEEMSMLPPPISSQVVQSSPELPAIELKKTKATPILPPKKTSQGTILPSSQVQVPDNKKPKTPPILPPSRTSLTLRSSPALTKTTPIVPPKKTNATPTSTPKPTASTPILPPKRSNTPIVPPTSVFSRLPKERSVTPLRETESSRKTDAAVATPKVTPKEATAKVTPKATPKPTELPVFTRTHKVTEARTSAKPNARQRSALDGYIQEAQANWEELQPRTKSKVVQDKIVIIKPEPISPQEKIKFDAPLHTSDKDIVPDGASEVEDSDGSDESDTEIVPVRPESIPLPKSPKSAEGDVEMEDAQNDKSGVEEDEEDEDEAAVEAEVEKPPLASQVLYKNSPSKTKAAKVDLDGDVEMEPREDESEAEDSENEDASSTHSSVLDTRSPVVFSQHASSEIPPLTQLPEPAIATHDEDTQSGSDSEDEEIEEKLASEDEDEENEYKESSDEEDDSRKTPVQVPRSSLLRTRSSSPLKQESQASQSKPEVRSSGNVIKSTQVPASSAPAARPAIKGGASLSSLLAKKPSFGASMNSSQAAPLRKQQRHVEEDSSDSDSDSDSSSESSDDDGPSKQLISQQSQSRPRSSLDETEAEATRRELAAEIAGAMAGSGGKKKAGKELKKKSSSRYLSSFEEFNL